MRTLSTRVNQSRRLTIIVLLSGLLAVNSAVAITERIVAIGDIHGDYQALVGLLQEIDLINEDDQWIGGQTHLVSLGDMLDRGPASRRVMDLFRSLEASAPAQGGKVHVLLGNHELMNLTGNTRDVSAAEYAAFGGPEAHAQAFSPTGEYGQWLQSKPAALQLNRTLFLHGGLSHAFSTVAQVNRAVEDNLGVVRNLGFQAGLGALLDLQPEQYVALPKKFAAAVENPVFGADGPFWYRGNARCHAHIEGPDVAAKLAALGLERVIVGHTPTATREIVQRFDGKVWVIDTGMLSAVYRGNPRALELVQAGGETQLKALPVAGAKITAIDELLAARTERQFQALQTGTVVETADGPTIVYQERSYRVAFTELGRAKRRMEAAAFLVDRELGLNLVQPVAVRQLKGRKGTLAVARATVSERERDFLPASECYRGSINGSEFDLVSVFDSLIGKLDRTADNLHYDNRSHTIVLVDNYSSFSTRGTLPTYTKSPVLSATLAQALRALDQQGLEALLNGLLKPAQIKGILKRRDQILEWERRET